MKLQSFLRKQTQPLLAIIYVCISLGFPPSHLVMSPPNCSKTTLRGKTRGTES